MLSLDLPLSNVIRSSGGNGPSIFLLHGYGSNMHDLFNLSATFESEWTCVSLQADIPIQFNGWAWAELDHRDISVLPKPNQFYESQEKVISSVDVCIQELELDPNRVNILGFSQGASMSLFCGLKRPEKFESIISLCGFLPINQIISEIDQDKVKGVKVFMGNGIKDYVVPMKLAKKTEEQMRSIKASVAFKEYECEHTISSECLRDVLSWLY